MAEILALTTGNWSSVAVFPVAPVSGDTVIANGKTVTIDVDFNIGTGTIQTLAGATGVNGGGFTITSNRTITCNILAGTTTCLTITSGNVTIVGNSTGSSVNGSRIGISWTSTGTLTFNGNVNGGGVGGASSSTGLTASAGTLNFTGVATAGASAATNYGLSCTGTTATIIGVPVASSACDAVNVGAGVVTFNSNLTNSSTLYEAVKCGGGTTTFNGSITATTAAYPVVLFQNTATVIFNGTLTAVNDTPAVYCKSISATVTVNGNLIASADGTPAISSSVSVFAKIIVNSTANQVFTFAKSGGTRNFSTSSGTTVSNRKRFV